MDAYLQIADAINKETSEILGRALAGYVDDYKFKRGQEVFVRWGLVEKDIHAAVIRNLTADA